MTVLTIIGFVAIVAFAIYVTAAAISIAFSEMAFSGRLSPLSFVLAVISVGLWALTYWLSPFTISMGIA